LRIIAICGAHKQGKTLVSQLMAQEIPNCYIISMYAILDWVYPGHKAEDHKVLLDKILSIRKNFFIDSIKVKLAFLPESYETIIIDDVDRKMNAITVCVNKEFSSYIPFHMRDLYTSADYFKTKYTLEVPTLITDTKRKVYKLVHQIEKDELNE
jgi:hypothetical protein